ncbi:hypothetical protein EDB89DRAFT_1910156 [Lactarius sanguifluus]|nr:hypothetical protein EDB89DRAFT_1910156 [Lactarius sanguifluus]
MAFSDNGAATWKGHSQDIQSPFAHSKLNSDEQSKHFTEYLRSDTPRLTRDDTRAVSPLLPFPMTSAPGDQGYGTQDDEGRVSIAARLSLPFSGEADRGPPPRLRISQWEFQSCGVSAGLFPALEDKGLHRHGNTGVVAGSSQCVEKWKSWSWTMGASIMRKIIATYTIWFPHTEMARDFNGGCAGVQVLKNPPTSTTETIRRGGTTTMTTTDYHTTTRTVHELLRATHEGPTPTNEREDTSSRP